MTVVQFDSGLFLTGARCQATEVFSTEAEIARRATVGTMGTITRRLDKVSDIRHSFLQPPRPQDTTRPMIRD